MNIKSRDVTEIFGRLAQQNQAVGESITVRSFEAGELVCEASEMVSSLFLVVSGRVQLFRASEEGRRYVVATLGPGSM